MPGIHKQPQHTSASAFVIEEILTPIWLIRFFLATIPTGCGWAFFFVFPVSQTFGPGVLYNLPTQMLGLLIVRKWLPFVTKRKIPSGGLVHHNLGGHGS